MQAGGRTHETTTTDRRRSYGVILLGAFLVLVAAGCSSDEPGSAATSTTAATTGSTVAPRPSPLEHRPVLALLPPGATAGPDVLVDTSSTMAYRLGPATVPNPAIESAEVVRSPNGLIEVQLVLAPGAAGIDLFNEVARRCHEQDATCPTGQLALVVDDIVLSAPRIAPDQAAFLPFERDQITLAGGFDEGAAEAIAARLTAG